MPIFLSSLSIRSARDFPYQKRKKKSNAGVNTNCADLLSFFSSPETYIRIWEKDSGMFFPFPPDFRERSKGLSFPPRHTAPPQTFLLSVRGKGRDKKGGGGPA